MKDSITAWTFIGAILILMTFACVDDDTNGGEFVLREEPLKCFPGFELSADQSECICPPGKFKIGNEECFDTLPPGFVYSSLPDCPAGLAIKLETEETRMNPFIRYGVEFDRFRLKWIIPVASVSGFSIDNSNFYLTHQFSESVDSVIFKLRPRGYFSQEMYDEMPGIPNLLFTGVLDEDQVLSGDLTWGYTTEREVIREKFGSCKASWNLR